MAMPTEEEKEVMRMRHVHVEAARVAREYAEHQTAIRAERDAETVILQQAIEAVQPALRSLASKIPRKSYGRPINCRSHHDQLGVVMIDDWYEEPEETGNRGIYGGVRLYLLSNGRLAEVERAGKWNGEVNEFTTQLIVVTPRYAMDTWDLHKALEGLVKALGAQRRPSQTADSRKRTERLIALAKLSK